MPHRQRLASGQLVALRSHRGRRPDALDVGRVAGIAKAADQERHVRPLAAPVGVQLIEHQELKFLAALIRSRSLAE